MLKILLASYILSTANWQFHNNVLPSFKNSNRRWKWKSILTYNQIKYFHVLYTILWFLDDFESGEIKLKKAELTSNLDTSDEEANVSVCKRKRRLRRFSSSCSSGNEDNSPVKRPPALKIKKGNRGQCEISLHFEKFERFCFTVRSSVVEQTAAVSQIGNTLQINDEVKSTMTHKTTSESPLSATPHRSRLLTPTSIKTIEIDAKGELIHIQLLVIWIISLFLAYQTLLQKLISIQHQNVQILSLLEQNNKSNVNDGEVPHFPVPIPLQSQEDLHNLETFLEHSEHIVVIFLNCFDKAIPT